MNRHICNLRVTCSHIDDAQHGRVLLEDALRTASFGDEGQLVIVRRLDLGKLSPRSSATAWSRRVEETYRRAHPVPVRFDHPTATEANAVVFAHRYEPWLVLAERLALNQTCHEWFWRLAVPGWRPEDSTEVTLRLCFRSLAQQGGLPLTLHLAARLAARFELFMLLRYLQPEDLAAIRAEIGTDTVATSEQLEAEKRIDPCLPPAESAIVNLWGATDVRTAWLTRVQGSRLVADLNQRPSTLPLAQRPRARDLAPSVFEQITLNWTETGKAPSAARPRLDPKIPDDARGTSEDEPFRLAAWLPERMYTTAGGLFFIIPLLIRAQFPAYLASLSPEARAMVPWQLFKLVLRHSRVFEGDPLFASLRDLPPPKVRLGGWLLAAHHASRRSTGLTLRQLVARPGLVALSATHLDVFFRLDDADVRIRRAALDLNPGWIPWLSRAIAFHFNRPESP
jgi:hypothetical protein